MLRKLRNRIKRSQLTSEDKKTGKDRSSKSSIFRNARPLGNAPTVEPALTWSLSNDDLEENDNHFVPSPQVQKISSYIFSEQDLMTNELNHMRQMAKKQEEIAKLQEVHAELTQLLASKDEEIDDMKEELEFKDRELKETYQELSDKDDELVETRMELAETKKELNVVGATLMKCQHELHEKMSHVWPW